MIHVLTDTKIIFVRGVHKISAIEDAVLEAIGRKRWINRDEWTVVGLADDNSRGMETALPFSPPQEDRTPVGYKF